MASCRACLSTDEELIPFDDMFVRNYNTLTSLEVKLDDDLSHYACRHCWQAVNDFIKFRSKCITSESVMGEAVLNVVKDELEKDFMEAMEKFDDHNSIKDKLKMEYNDLPDEDIQENYEFEEANMLDHNIGTLLSKKIFTLEGIQSDLKANISRKKKSKTIKNYAMTKSSEMPCGICAKLYQDQKELNEHLESHKNNKICAICQEVFSEWPELLSHRHKHIPKKQRRCHICFKYYKSCISMEYHYRNYHYNGNNLKIKCKYCHRSYVTPVQLKKHVWSTHSVKKLICDYCSKTFNNKQRLMMHIVGHTEHKAYVCDVCGFSCKYKSGIMDHTLRKHTPKRVNCKNCRRVFANQTKMDTHICKQENKLCPKCGKEIKGTARMSRHMETHREEKRYKCDRCPSRYTSKAALEAHQNRHDANPTKRCEFCPAKFYSASVLIKHRRIHTGERPYVCKICERGFTGNSNLKIHMKVHGEHLINKRIKPEDCANN